MGDQNKNPNVALILQNSSLLVDRKQLIDKSQYFASLLSENYIDHLQQEHVINYDIPISTLKVSIVFLKFIFIPIMMYFLSFYHMYSMFIFLFTFGLT